MADRYAYQRQLPALTSLNAVRLPQQLLYRDVLLTGQFVHDAVRYLDNRVMNGRAGYHVIVPMRLANDVYVMVNRGWLPKRPEKSVDVPELPRGVVTVSGQVAWPRSKPWIAGENSEQGRVWNWLDIARVSQQLSHPILSVIILEHPDQTVPYQRDWPVLHVKVGMHIGYAIHWGVFALFSVGLYVYYLIKRREIHT